MGLAGLERVAVERVEEASHGEHAPRHGAEAGKEVRERRGLLLLV